MADTKLTGLPTDTSLSGAENLYLVDDPSGTPTSKKSTLNAFKTFTGVDSKKSFHGVVARPIGVTNPLPTNLTTPVFTLGATTNPISYYYQGTLVNVTSDKVAVLDDATGATTTSGVLVSGKRYVITTFVAGDDFTNIATVLSGTINTTGCIFTATGTTPTTWTNGSSLRELVSSASVYFVYFNTTTGDILATKSHPGVSYLSNVIISAVNWNGTDYGLVSDERHGYMRDTVWHEWAHDTIGARYVSGLSFAPTGKGATSSFTMTAGEIADEDIEFAIPASSSFPTAHSMRLFWQTGASSYAFDKTPSTQPYKRGTGDRPVYINSSSSYAITTLNDATNRYVNFFIYGTTSLHTPIYCFAETQTSALMANGYTSIANAQAIPWPNLSGFNLVQELKPLYRLVVRADGTVQAQTAIDDYRTVSSLPMSAGTSSTTSNAVSRTPTTNLLGATVETALQELNPMTTAGDLITAGTDGVCTRLPMGAATHTLRVNADGTALEFAAPSGGTVVDYLKFPLSGVTPNGTYTLMTSSYAFVINEVFWTSKILPVGSARTLDIRLSGTATTDSIFTSDTPLSMATNQALVDTRYTNSSDAIDNGTVAAEKDLSFTLAGGSTSGTADDFIVLKVTRS